MNMQHRCGIPDDRVSAKGWRLLARDDDERAAHAACLRFAGREYACESRQRADWFCLVVDAGREKIVEEAMVNAGIDASVPMRMGPERRRRHKVVPPESIPVLTGYVMVRCVHSAGAMRALWAFDHVRGMVGGWEGRHRIADEKMCAFKQMAAAGLFDWERPASLFRKGTMVEVTEGPFVSFSGPIVAFGGAGKGDAVVELALFGRSSPVLISLAMLRPL